MKRILKVTLIVAVVVFAVASLVGYFVGRSKLKDLPPLLQNTLKEQGIQFSYQDVVVPPVGLRLELSKVNVTGAKLPYYVKTEEAHLGIGLTFGLPFLKVYFKLRKPEITENETYQPEVKPADSKPTELGAVKYAGIFLKLVKFQAGVEQCTLEKFGVFGMDADVMVWGLGLSNKGLGSAKLRHEVKIQKYLPLEQLSPLSTSGKSFYSGDQVELSDGTLEVGPFLMTASGKFEIATKKWAGTLTIPDTYLKNGSNILNATAKQWIEDISGNLGLRITGNGVAGDFETIEAKGTIRAKDLKVTTKLPQIKGQIQNNLEVEFVKTKTLGLNAQLTSDLTSTEIDQKNQFKKPKGIPLALKIKAEGKNNQIHISESSAQFHTLIAQVTGQIAADSKNPTGNIQIRIPNASFEGWEKFFPQYPGLKTEGNLEATLGYQGPFKDWKAATLNAEMKIQNLKLPIMKSWIPKKEVNIQGLLSMKSDTKLSFSQGEIKDLYTDTSADLTQNLVEYGEFFKKPEKTPLKLDLLVTSNSKSAEFKKATLLIGPHEVTAKGKIENFKNPYANLTFASTPISLAELSKLLPVAQMKTLTNFSGLATMKGTVQGPLMAKNSLPNVRGEMILSKLTADYEMENKKKIKVLNGGGTALFSTNSFTLKKFHAQLPKTDGILDLDVQNFESPKVTFNLEANKVTMADFYDPPAKGQGGVGLVTVPVQLPAKTNAAGKVEATAADFRKNPYLKNLALNGRIKLKNLDLGYATSELAQATLSFQNMRFKMEPAFIKIYGGTLNSSTDWNGQPEVPDTKLTLKLEGVDANEFASSWSPDYKDIILGKLFSDINLTFQGLTPEQIKKTTKGNGTFNLKNGEIKTLKLTQKPMEALKAIPSIGGGIQKTSWEEKLNDVKGSFTILDGKILFSNMSFQSNLFDLEASQASLDFSNQISSKVTWYPKESLISAASLEFLKDERGRPSVPLTIQGPIKSPAVGVDNEGIQERLKLYASRRLEQEKNKALDDLKNKAQQELQNQLKEFKLPF